MTSSTDVTEADIVFETKLVVLSALSDDLSDRKLCCFDVRRFNDCSPPNLHLWHGVHARWNEETFGPDFSLSPLEGIVAPLTETGIEVVFTPERVDDDIRREGVLCMIEVLLSERTAAVETPSL